MTTNIVERRRGERNSADDAAYAQIRAKLTNHVPTGLRSRYEMKPAASLDTAFADIKRQELWDRIGGIPYPDADEPANPNVLVSEYDGLESLPGADLDILLPLLRKRRLM